MWRKGGRSAAVLFVSLAGVLAVACGAATVTETPAQETAAPAAQEQRTPTPGAGVPTPTATADDAALDDSAGLDWTIEEIDRGTKPALALTSDDVPYVAYMLEAQSGFVKSAVRREGSWDRSVVAEGYFYGPLDVAAGPDDTPRIVYHDHQDSSFRPNKGDVAYASLENGEWSVDAISDPGHDGWDTRLAVDAGGLSHVSAIDPEEFGGRGLEYYVQDDSGAWTVEPVGTGPMTYKYATSVAVDPDGVPHISFFDQRSDSLALASKNGVDWTVSIVDGEGDTGLFSQLLIDGDGRFHISYLERTAGSTGVVKYATRGAEDTGWTIREIDNLDRLSFGFVGARNATSLALDPLGNPWVAYSDEATLRLAIWEGAAWEIRTVVDAGNRALGQLVSLKLDSGGDPHLAYFEVTSSQPLDGRVMYARGTPR